MDVHQSHGLMKYFRGICFFPLNEIEAGGKSNAIVLSNKFHGFPNIHFIDDPNFTIWNELICRESNGDEIASKFVQDFEIIMNERPKLTRSISTTSIISTNSNNSR